MRIRMIGATVGSLILAGTAAALVAGPAQATTAEDCKTVTVHLSARPDSGVKGNDWAVNDMTRVTKVCATAKPAEGDWTYKATVTDTGTFETKAGDSPNGTATLKGGVKGTIKGGFTATFTAPKGWDAGLAPVAPPATTSTGDWVATAFPGAKFDNKGAVADWSWTYKTACESWTNAEAGSTGDVTEKVCPTPTPTPTVTATAAPTPTVAATTPAAAPSVTPAPGAGGGLPVTGTPVAAIVGGGLVLLALGVGALWLARRRVIRTEA